MARCSAWTVGLLLALAGSQGAHVLAYLAVTPDAGHRAVVLHATGHAYFTYLPLAFLPGLLLQLPLGALAYLVAHALLSGADRVAALLRSSPRPVAARPHEAVGFARVERAPAALTAGGRTTRGPPLAVAA